MADHDLPRFKTRTAREVLSGLVKRGGQINESASGHAVTDEKHKDFGRLVYNVWFPRDPKYPVWDDNCNFRLTEAANGFVSMEADFRLSGMHGDAHITKHFTIPTGRSRQGKHAWEGVDQYLALFRRLRSTSADEVISHSKLHHALTLLWWGMDQSMKNADWSPSDFEPLRKAWSEVSPLWTPPRDDDDLPDYVRNALDIPWPEEEPMPRPSRPTKSSITEEVRTERKITVTMSAADIDAAYATLTVDIVTMRNPIPTLADAFFRGLEEQCKLRKERGTFVHNDEGKSELEWIVKEREFMFQQVNLERAGLHKPAKTMADIRRVETMAAGHSDYTRKFAIYCAELVLLDKEPQP